MAGALSYQDDLAIVHVAATLRQVVWDGVATVYAEIADGFERASRSVPHSRPDAGGRFVKASFQATMVQDLGAGFAAFGEVDGQISDRPLLSAAEFAVIHTRITVYRSTSSGYVKQTDCRKKIASHIICE